VLCEREKEREKRETVCAHIKSYVSVNTKKGMYGWVDGRKDGVSE
jgi:hypothetical protein